MMEQSMKRYLSIVIAFILVLYMGMNMAFAESSGTENLHVKLSNEVSDQSFILKKTPFNASAKQFEGRAIINKAVPLEYLVPFQLGKHNVVMNIELPEDAGRQCSVDVWYFGEGHHYNVVITNYSNQYKCSTELVDDQLSVVIQDGAVEQVLVPFKIKNNTHNGNVVLDILELSGIALSINYNNHAVPPGMEGVFQARFQDGVNVIFRHDQKNERMNAGFYSKIALNIVSPDGFTAYRVATPDFILFNNTLLPKTDIVVNHPYKVEWITGEDGVITLTITDSPK